MRSWQTVKCRYHETLTDVTATNSLSVSTVQLKTLHPPPTSYLDGWAFSVLLVHLHWRSWLAQLIHTYLFLFGCDFLYFCSVYIVLFYVTEYKTKCSSVCTVSVTELLAMSHHLVTDLHLKSRVTAVKGQKRKEFNNKATSKNDVYESNFYSSSP